MSASRSLIPSVPIRASDWNDAVDEYRQNRPLITRLSGGYHFPHPWKTDLEWLGERWGVRVRPGFVNGDEVEMRIEKDFAPDLTIKRLATGRDVLPDEVDAYLTEDPRRPVRPSGMRKIGPDAPPTSAGSSGLFYDPVPEFFSALGVGEPRVTNFDIGGGGLVEQIVPGRDRERERLLRAFEIVLVQERLATTVEWTYGTATSNASFDVIYTNTDHRKLAYLSFSPAYEPFEDGATPLDRVTGVWEDRPYDELRVATCYLVSPPGANYDSDPDGTWEPYVQHHLFWNLNHATNLLPGRRPADPVTWFIGVGGVVGQSLIQGALAIQNDALDEATEFLNNRTLAGRFWTT